VPMEKVPQVSIVILTYNSGRFIKRCLESVLNTYYPNFEVILVDNASTDGSIKLIQSLCEKNPASTHSIKVIKNKKNLGFAEGNNVGIRSAKGKFVALLNPDTEVDPNWLDESIKVVENCSIIGIAQSMLLKMDKDNRIQHAGLFIIDYCGWTWKFYKEGMYSEFLKRCSKPIVISSSAAAAMIIRRDLLKEIGLFDPKFFIYFEDVDLSWRAWLRGYKVVLAPKSVVYHFGGGSIKNEVRASIFREFNHYKNCLRMLAKNYGFWHGIVFLPTASVCMFAKALIHMVKGDAGSIVGLLKAFFWNIKEVRGTILERFRVQLLRKVGDDYIIKNAMRRLSFFEMIRRL